MQTSAQNPRSIQVPTYTMSFKAYKVGGIKKRKIVIYQNGQWIYRDEFKAEEKAKREQFAQNFLHAMKLHDTRQIMAALDQMKGF